MSRKEKVFTAVLFAVMLVSPFVHAEEKKFVPANTQQVDAATLEKMKAAANQPVAQAVQKASTGKTGELTATPLPNVVEGNTVTPTSVTLYQPPCGDYEYQGSNVRPLSGGPTNYQCPPGYKCHRNGLLYECRFRDGLSVTEPLPATSPFCRYEACS